MKQSVATTQFTTWQASILPSFIVGPPRTPRTDSESLLNMRQALEGEVSSR